MHTSPTKNWFFSKRISYLRKSLSMGWGCIFFVNPWPANLSNSSSAFSILHKQKHRDIMGILLSQQIVQILVTDRKSCIYHLVVWINRYITFKGRMFCYFTRLAVIKTRRLVAFTWYAAACAKWGRRGWLQMWLTLFFSTVLYLIWFSFIISSINPQKVRFDLKTSDKKIFLPPPLQFHGVEKKFWKTICK